VGAFLAELSTLKSLLRMQGVQKTKLGSFLWIGHAEKLEESEMNKYLKKVDKLIRHIYP
jgi:hypothetical protein